MAGIYNLSWYMSLTYDQWARSGSWILGSMQQDLKTGAITETQWTAIMKRRSDLYQRKVDAALAKGTVVEQGSGGNLGHASLPPEKADKSFLDKIGDAMTFPSIKTAVDNVTNAATMITGGASKTLLIVGGALVLILIFKGRR